MRRELHITGGKNTTEMLRKIAPQSEVITWNEMLSEGKTTTDVGSEHFWRSRYEFLKSEYNIGKKSFIDNVLKEYRNLCQQKTQDEAVLWFSEDLQSQINMIAVMSWLKKYRKNIHITWVKEPISAKTTQKDAKQYYQARQVFNIDDLEYADYIWQLYCSKSPLQLEIQANANTTTHLTALPEALKLHLQRFPSVKNGLSSVENEVLTTAYTFKGSAEDLAQQMVKSQPHLGYSSLQFSAVIERLKDLFSSLNPLKINLEGEQVLADQINMYPILRNDDTYLGGALKYDFLRYGDSDKLLKL